MEQKSMVTPELSVVMSVYNTPLDFLRESIDSILNQTFKDFEFIIIDDGNSDGGIIGLLSDYRNKDGRIRIISNDTNLGLTKSLNIGLDNCSGKYIARMDADDISLPDRFRTQLNFLDENPEISLVGSNTIGFDGDRVLYDESLLHRRTDKQEIFDIRMLLENVCFAHPTFMFRKQFLDEKNIRYREDLRYAQDYGIVIDILNNYGKIHKIEKSLLKYREHQGQISQKSHGQQEQCQSLTSFRRLKFIFPGVSEKHCKMISDLMRKDEEHEPNEYISAIKSVLEDNNHNGQFNGKILKEELMYEWYRKCMRNTRKSRKLWGLTQPFSLTCIPIVLKMKIQNRFIFYK